MQRAKSAPRADSGRRQHRGGGNLGSATKVELLELVKTTAKTLLRKQLQPRHSGMKFWSRNRRRLPPGFTNLGPTAPLPSAPRNPFGNFRTNLRIHESDGSLARCAWCALGLASALRVEEGTKNVPDSQPDVRCCIQSRPERVSRDRVIAIPITLVSSE